MKKKLNFCQLILPGRLCCAASYLLKWWHTKWQNSKFSIKIILKNSKNLIKHLIVKLCVHFVSVFKNGHRLTLKSLFTRSPENFFWSQMKGIAKIRLFYSDIMVLILLPLKEIAHFLFYNFIIYNVYNEAKILPLWSLSTLCLYKVIKKEGGKVEGHYTAK